MARRPRRDENEGQEGGEERRSVLFPPLPDAMPGARELAEAPLRDRAYSEFLESQCGATDDSQPVEQYDGSLGVTQAFVDAHQAAVGQIQWNSNLASIYTNPGNVSGVRWATGALIAPNLFLTAGHNFDQTGGGWSRPRDNMTGAIIPPAEIATNMHVNFNFQIDPAGNPRPEQEFRILELVEYRLGGLDFAIVRLEGNPGALFGISTVSTADAAVGQTICIIGHPAGVPKRIEAGPVTDLHGSRIGYNDVDTLGGNSGSCILRSPDGQIVGVHTNGGCTVADPNNNPDHNHGVRITSIIAASPTLQTLTAPTQKFADDIGSLKAADDPITRKFAEDIGTLKVVDDGGTRKFLDDPVTRKFQDDIGTLKAVDDPQTRKFLDDLQTRPDLDQIGTVKAIDDVKQPGLDKGPADAKLPGSDGMPPFAGGGPAQAGARPFVMATPHHSMNWAAGGQQGQAGGMGQFPGGQMPGGQVQAAQVQAGQYEQAIAALAAEIEQRSAELDQMMVAYHQLVAEYQAFGAGQP